LFPLKIINVGRANTKKDGWIVKYVDYIEFLLEFLLLLKNAQKKIENKMDLFTAGETTETQIDSFNSRTHSLNVKHIHTRGIEVYSLRLSPTFGLATSQIQ